MSDDNNQTADEQHVFARAGDLDWYLQGFIKLSNKGLQFPLTLTCGGILVSGTLIGGKEYFSLSADLVSSGFSDEETKAVIAEWVSSWGTIYDDSAEDSDGEQTSDRPQFIHLKDAKYYVPGQPPIPTSQSGTLWRGRLAEVVGFNYGALHPGK